MANRPEHERNIENLYSINLAHQAHRERYARVCTLLNPPLYPNILSNSSSQPPWSEILSQCHESLADPALGPYSRARFQDICARVYAEQGMSEYALWYNTKAQDDMRLVWQGLEERNLLDAVRQRLVDFTRYLVRAENGIRVRKLVAWGISLSGLRTIADVEAARAFYELRKCMINERGGGGI